MALLAWDSISYSVGVKIHRRSALRSLSDLINDLHEAMMKGQAQSLAGALLNKLVDYTQDPLYLRREA